MSKCNATFTCMNCGKKINVETNGLIKLVKEMYNVNKQHKKECKSC